MILDYKKYIEKEQANWNALEKTCLRIEEDAFVQLSIEEIQQFYMHYRRAASALAHLQDAYAAISQIEYLEQLVGRAYSIIYSHSRKAPKIHWFSWFFQDFPRVFRLHRYAFALSLAVMLLGCAFGGLLLSREPQLKTVILPFGNGTTDPVKRVADEESGKNKTAGGQKGTFSAFLIRNNISVSIRAIAFGITFGIGTLLLIFNNGVMLGGVCFDYLAAGKGAFLAGWLLPHGSIEIPSILIAGQAGFLIAGALVGHGSGRLRVRLKAIGPDLAILVGAIVILLVWAGLIEGFFSQYHEPVIPYWLKMTFGTLELSALSAFLLLGGKNDKKDRK